ncbi:MAG: DUF4962 domain-containing protein [Thermogutta sp.]
MQKSVCFVVLSVILGFCLGAADAEIQLPLDERATQPGEWGYRPEDGTVSAVDPPPFSWRPQKEVELWEIQIARDGDFQSLVYQAKDVTWNVHCPPQAFGSGRYFWRYRGHGKNSVTAWSRTRSFTIEEKALPFPMPPRDELLARIPKQHPRLFIRPEDRARLKQAAEGPQKELWKTLVARCDQAVKNPPPTQEPPKYPPDIEWESDEWAKIWWGNREYTIRALSTSALLGFVYQIGGHRLYGELAKKILLECAEWDPLGATGYGYNDEAGMPYAYYFCRTYTFVYDLLTEEERQKCRQVMKIRGDEMYRTLCPRHFWQPYNSHANRAWHFLGEVGITFHQEIPEADDWTWFAMNVFFNTYPVWSDDDGGWHEGSSYWASYMQRFTWWADVMRATFGIDAYRKPYFSKAGYYAMYLMPPHGITGGFGDLACTRESRSNVPLMSVFAAQAQNPYWTWYAESMGGTPQPREFWEFIRGALPTVAAKPPVDLPSSRVFRGIGQAALNTTILDSRKNVQILFKSSPFGLQSHGYDANNAFLLTAYNERLFVSSGRRDIYGSAHHARWMWSTRSVNSITVDGVDQVPHSAATQGEITAFYTSQEVDCVQGEAGRCYLDPKAPAQENRQLLRRFTRTIIFLKPEWIVIYDQLAANRPVSYQYWLHSPERMEIKNNELIARVGKVECPVQFLVPQALQMTQTNEYDPNPRPRINIREWHVKAETKEAASSTEFLVVYHPYQRGTQPKNEVKLETRDNGYVLALGLADGAATILLPKTDTDRITTGNLSTAGRILVSRRDSQGKELRQVVVEGIAAPQP